MKLVKMIDYMGNLYTDIRVFSMKNEMEHDLWKGRAADIYLSEDPQLKRLLKRKAYYYDLEDGIITYYVKYKRGDEVNGKD